MPLLESLLESRGAFLIEDFSANFGNEISRPLPDLRRESVGAAECVQQVAEVDHPGEQRDFLPRFPERAASVRILVMVQYHAADVGAERQGAEIFLAKGAVQTYAGHFRQEVERFGTAVKFLLDILSQRVVVEQGAGGEVLQCAAADSHSDGCAYAHISHALCVAAGDVYQLGFHAVERVGAGTVQPQNIKFHIYLLCG